MAIIYQTSNHPHLILPWRACIVAISARIDALQMSQRFRNGICLWGIALAEWRVFAQLALTTDIRCWQSSPTIPSRVDSSCRVTIVIDYIADWDLFPVLVEGLISRLIRNSCIPVVWQTEPGMRRPRLAVVSYFWLVFRLQLWAT